MLKKLSTVDLLLSVKRQIKELTGIDTYDTAPPKDAPSPLYYVQFANSTPDNTKMMFRDRYSIVVHAIGTPDGTNAEIYKMIDALEEVLTVEISLPEEVELIRQTGTGIQSVKTDETNEKHAIVGYDFIVAYGFRIK